MCRGAGIITGRLRLMINGDLIRGAEVLWRMLMIATLLLVQIAWCGSAGARGAGGASIETATGDSLVQTILHERSQAAGALLRDTMSASPVPKLAILTMLLSGFYGLAMGVAGGVR